MDNRRFRIRLVISSLTFLLILSRCSFGKPFATATVDPKIILTAAALKIADQLTLTPLAAAQLTGGAPGETPLPPAATLTQMAAPASPTAEAAAAAGAAGAAATATPQPAAGRQAAATEPPAALAASPTPLPTGRLAEGGFRLRAVNLHDCGGLPRPIFKITNTSGGALESLRLTIENLTAKTTLSGPADLDDPFLASDRDCDPGTDRLASGATGYVGGSPLGARLPAGQRVRATLLLCTQDQLAGKCYEETLEFISP